MIMGAYLWFLIHDVTESTRPCKILTEISPRSRRDLGENLGEFLAGKIAEISVRSQNLGGQKLTENLDKISSKILAKSQSLGGQNLA